MVRRGQETEGPEQGCQGARARARGKGAKEQRGNSKSKGEAAQTAESILSTVRHVKQLTSMTHPSEHLG